jgi:hypothetical protein
MPENSQLLLGAIGLIAGSMLSPVAGDLWRKIKGTEYATKADCKVKHIAMANECAECRAKTQSTICAIQHDAAKNRKLLLLIAFQLQIPRDELKDFL